ncbi:MAG: aminoacyl-tRNA hydrolase [Oscillospiraceae bacterium]|nr:aminoacyl-tRNA hydrolase [Oscillospiraceae bacterium]
MGIMDLFNQISAGTAAGGPVEYIIVGLGNPGIQYQDTRHNAGFMAIDTIAEKYGADVKRIKFKSLCGECTIGGKKCLLMKPSTYMNNSGEAVVEAMNFYKINIENLIVIYDDISLEPSKLRIRRKGSDGGHNGIKSIIYLTGEDTFPRIKIGVGKKPHPQYNLADWVLSNFKSDEIPLIREACQHAAESAELMVSGKINEAMNKYN